MRFSYTKIRLPDFIKSILEAKQITSGSEFQNTDRARYYKTILQCDATSFTVVRQEKIRFEF